MGSRPRQEKGTEVLSAHRRMAGFAVYALPYKWRF
jgi:hypothetical protein